MANAEQDKDGSGSRHPRNMQGVLRLAVENMVPTEGNPPEASTFRQSMNEERRKFLEEVFSSMSVNVVDIMKRSLNELVDPKEGEDSIERKENALDELMEWVDNMDFANDFQKIGGLSILQNCLKSPHSGIRHRSAEVIAELVQNNPYCQNAATEAKIVGSLLQLLDTDEDETVRVKSLYALSGLLRDNPAAQTEFSNLDGFSVLLRATQSNVQKLRLKSTFLLNSLCCEQPTFKETLCNMGFVDQLVGLLQTEHDLTHEHIMGALLALVNGYQRGIGECRRPELNLKETLKDRMEFLEGKEQFLEELEYAQQLSKLCFDDSEKGQEDR